eukprot:3137251-Rhodomonas_salina.1
MYVCVCLSVRAGGVEALGGRQDEIPLRGRRRRRGRRQVLRQLGVNEAQGTGHSEGTGHRAQGTVRAQGTGHRAQCGHRAQGTGHSEGTGHRGPEQVLRQLGFDDALTLEKRHAAPQAAQLQQTLELLDRLLHVLCALLLPREPVVVPQRAQDPVQVEEE